MTERGGGGERPRGRGDARGGRRRRAARPSPAKPSAPTPPGERLQKILARAGVASRRHAEELIAAGRVTVNGQVAALGDRADPEVDSVKLDGRRLRPEAPHRYFLINKPKGMVSTTADPEGRPTVLDLLPAGLRRGVAPVGRLDVHTEGLLLLTDDGDLAQRIAHPRYGCTKTYHVKVKGEPAAAEIARLRGGIVIEGRRTAPAVIQSLRTNRPRPVRRRQPRQAPAVRGAEGRPGAAAAGEAAEEGHNSWWMVQLGEGRKRQIREMFFRIGHPVLKLRRVAIGPVTAPDLPIGGWRELHPEELAALRQRVEREPRKPVAPVEPGRPREAGKQRKPRPPTAARQHDGAARGRSAARGGARPRRRPRSD